MEKKSDKSETNSASERTSDVFQSSTEETESSKAENGREGAPGLGAHVLYVMAEEGLSNDVTCEQKGKGREGANSGARRGKSAPGSGNPKCKGPRQESAGDVKEPAERPVRRRTEYSRRRSGRGDAGVGRGLASRPLARMLAFISNGS